MTSLSNQDADYMLGLSKRIIRGGEMLDEVVIEQEFGMNARHLLKSEEDDEYTFLWEINQSAKNSLRVSLHYQDNDTKIGLLRVDFNSGHQNPGTVSEFVPERLIPHAGRHFSAREHHIHYHVQGYRSLAWAAPLAEDEFEVKELDGGPGFNTDFGRAIMRFAEVINLRTIVHFNELLL